ncbi:MAG TPA: ABC transporter substrate-binding protein [Steroidobacteraceae bacterium]|jgi:branched-chain amino acid transport system substrate-binding protein|nr:ABC transporter substrate-binding protein [Steroidobacteraceae bacterium]
MTQPRISLILAILASAAVLAGCSKSTDSGTAAADATIKVGEFASLTGKEATFGQSSHKGTQLAIEQLNAAGGLLGKQIEFIYEDNRSTPGESATIAKKLITRDKVVALLGEVASGRSLEAAPIAQANKVPMISPSSTNPKVTETGDYIFRVCFIDPFQGKLLAEFAKRTLKAQKVAVFSDVSAPYSVGLAQFFRQSWTAGGGQIVSEQKYTGGDKDFKAQLTVIKNTKPDAIIVPGYYTDAGLIVAQARQLGINVPLFGGDGWEAPELMQIAGAAALEGTYYSTHFSPESTDPLAQKFVAAYKAKYSDEVPDAMAALGYDSVMVLADAIKRAGSTEGPKLRDALAATKDFPGATGVTSLDAKRDASKPAVIITAKDGKFHYVETIAP